MKKTRVSAGISLAICIASAALLLVWLFTFPSFFRWFYFDYHMLDQTALSAQKAVQTVVRCFYFSAPFAAAALGMLISLLVNILRGRVFIAPNVAFLRWVSWCCWAVFIPCFVFGLRYLPLMIIAFAMGVVGTLLRVVKNIMQAAVALQEENSLTV